MDENKLEGELNVVSSGSFFPFVMMLFFGSGCAALIYEIIWFQLLQLVIGSSAVSLGVLLATYMGGMCLGSIALPRIVSDRRHPLRVYALIELGIGIIGIGVLYGIPYINELYVSHVEHGLSGIFMRGLVCAICLLPPTFLMGATLPAIARWTKATPKGVSWLGFFYGGNIAGAVFGCLVAGFYLLRVYDMAVATYAAAAVNVAVASIGLTLSFFATYRTSITEPILERVENSNRPWTVYVVIALSGLCALGAEVIWTRLLSLMLGATVYTFSIILAVFLVGLGIGSSIGSFILRLNIRPRVALGFCQLFLVMTISYAAYMLTNSLPYWPIDPSISANPWYNFQLDLLRCVWAVLPAAFFWGASFPLALGAATQKGQDPGKLVGGVYAANTIGAIIGSIVFSMIMIPKIGTQQAQRLLTGLSAVSALLMILPPLWQFKEKYSLEKNNVLARGIAFIVILMIVTGLTAGFAWTVNKVPWELIAQGRFLPTNSVYDDAIPLYTGEGMNASIAISELSSGVKSFHVSGKVVASNDPQDMKLQLMLGHLPALFHPKPRSVLVVGCGAGVTAGSFILHPDVERIVICEIEPLIPKTAAEYFSQENNCVVDDPRVEIIYDDARHYILTTDEKFDIITSDPIHPWVKGAAALYTKEYFNLCKQRLNEGGIATQWVPLYESNMEAVKSEFATFFDVFPEGTIWGNDCNGEGYDVVLLGYAQAANIDVNELQLRLNSEEYSEVQRSLSTIGFGTALNLLSKYAGRGQDLKTWLEDAVINTDRNLRLQYLAGMGLNLYDEINIYQDMLAYRQFPEDLFLATDDFKFELKLAIEGW